MIPPGHFLLVLAEAPFRARLAEKDQTLVHEESLEGKGPDHFALFLPMPARRRRNKAAGKQQAAHLEVCRLWCLEA